MKGFYGFGNYYQEQSVISIIKSYIRMKPLRSSDDSFYLTLSKDGERCLLDRSRRLLRNITGRKAELVDLHFPYTLHKYLFVGGMIRSL